MTRKGEPLFSVIPSWRYGRGDATLPNREAAIFLCLSGALRCKVVKDSAMADSQRSVRQSVSLPPSVARRVRSLAQRRRTSANRVMVQLIESGLEAREQEKKRFFDLAERLTHSSDASERKQIKEELARLTFGE